MLYTVRSMFLIVTKHVLDKKHVDKLYEACPRHAVRNITLRSGAGTLEPIWWEIVTVVASSQLQKCKLLKSAVYDTDYSAFWVCDGQSSIATYIERATV